MTTNAGGVYFCATTPAVGDSSLATGGVVLYVLVQRALAEGAKVLGNTRELTAGDPAGEDPADVEAAGRAPRPGCRPIIRCTGESTGRAIACWR